MTEVSKVSHVVPISREMAIDAGLVEPTIEERAELDRQAGEYVRRATVREVKLDAARHLLAGLTDPLARDVLDLHSEDDHGECEGCDYSGYEGEPPSWPCRTVEAVASRFGVEIP